MVVIDNVIIHFILYGTWMAMAVYFKTIDLGYNNKNIRELLISVKCSVIGFPLLLVSIRMYTVHREINIINKDRSFCF